MKSLYCFILTLIIVSCTAEPVSHPSRLVEAPAVSEDMSETRLAAIDSMLTAAIEEGEIPGAVALVARNGKIVYNKAFGFADVESGREFRTDDIFRIASQTKAITSTAVMMLWEKGLFRLDDPISKYIPEFANPAILASFDESDSSYTTVPAGKQITIRHLLTHTSGLGYGMIDSDARFRKIYQKAGIIDGFTTSPVKIGDNTKKLAGLPLHFNPGEKYSYAEGLDVLGYFIEIMSGMPLDKFFRENILDPLGMDDTWFYLPQGMEDRLVPVQTMVDGKWKIFPASSFYDPDYPVKGAKTFFAGGAGLCSTAEDYAKFLQMYLNMGEYNGTRLLSRTTVQFIMANQIGDLWGADPDKYYGLAFGVLTKKGQDRGGQGSEGTFDWGGYFNTQYFADPAEQLIGVLMKQTQDIPGDNTGWKFRILAGQAIDD